MMNNVLYVVKYSCKIALAIVFRKKNCIDYISNNIVITTLNSRSTSVTVSTVSMLECSLEILIEKHIVNYRIFCLTIAIYLL